MADQETLADAELNEAKPGGLLSVLGPGLITGASDDDPSGIATYSQAGAQFGYSLSWVMLFSWPLMSAIQEISARIGRVTGRGIAGNIKQHYPAPILVGLVFLLIVANTINLGADIGAMAAALKLLIGGPILVYVGLFAVASLLLEIFVDYPRYVAVLKWLTLSLFAYVAVALSAPIPWREMDKTSSSRSFPPISHILRWWSLSWGQQSAPIFSSGRRKKKSKTSESATALSPLSGHRSKLVAN